MVFVGVGNDILLLRPGEDIHAAEHMSLSAHSGSVESVSFSPDGSLLASGSGDYTVKLWNVSSGVCVKTLAGCVVCLFLSRWKSPCIWFM
jgi:WD40 repeat protein